MEDRNTARVFLCSWFQKCLCCTAHLWKSNSAYCGTKKQHEQHLLQSIFQSASRLVRYFYEPRGASLTESQEPSTPSVFVMKNGTNVACLVKDFYPKSVDIQLYPDNSATEGVVTTTNGKYSAVKLGQYKKDLEQIKCTVQHNNMTVEASYKSSHEDSTDKSSDPEDPIDQLSSFQKCHKPSVQIEKVNLLSITLLGLRVLLAKSIAVNIFLTIKCFLH